VQIQIYADNLFGAGAAFPTSITWTDSILTVMSKRDLVDTWEHISICKYRMAHEKPARRLVDQRGGRSRTLYRKLNRWKCKVITG